MGLPNTSTARLLNSIMRILKIAYFRIPLASQLWYCIWFPFTHTIYTLHVLDYISVEIGRRSGPRSIHVLYRQVQFMLFFALSHSLVCY